MPTGIPMHRGAHPPPDPLAGQGFDEMLKQQRQRIRRTFAAMTVRRREVYQTIMDTTQNDWTMIGNTKGAWGHGAKPRGN